jgi:hypothetical protein
MEAAEIDDTGRTTQSVTWATSVASDKSPMGKDGVQQTDLIDMPANPMEMDIGTAVPYAQYIEHGSQPHQKSSVEESERFITNMLDWARRHGWQKREGATGDLDKNDIYPLLMRIRNYGTDKNPFMQDSRQAIEPLVPAAFAGAIAPLMSRFVRGVFKKQKSITVTVGIK